MYWCETMACTYKFFLDWQTLIAGGLALLGAWITVRALKWQYARGLAQQQRVAAMQVAAQIRRWLIDTTHAFEIGPDRVAEDRAANPDDDPDLYVFPHPGDIPKFPFQDALESISLLKSTDAKSLFDVIERRLSAERTAIAEAEFGSDNAVAAEIFEALIAAVYLECASIYSKLARQVGWPADAVRDEEIKTMREKASKLDEIRNRPSDVDFGEAEA
jgi:hypothetical protein